MDMQNITDRASSPPPQAAHPSTPCDASGVLDREQSIVLQNSSAIVNPHIADIIHATPTTVIAAPSSQPQTTYIPNPENRPDSQVTTNPSGGTNARSSSPLMWDPVPLSIKSKEPVISNAGAGHRSIAPSPPKPPSLEQTSNEIGPAITMQRTSGATGSAMESSSSCTQIGRETMAQPQPLSFVVSNISVHSLNTPKKPVSVKPSPEKNMATTSLKRKRQRKRGNESGDEIKAHDSDSDSDDDSEDLLRSPRQTKSGRQVNRPAFFAPSPETTSVSKHRTSPLDPAAAGLPVKRRRKVYRKNGKEINVICRHCQRGHSPFTNMIVFCDECNDAYHQYCHDPPVQQALIDDKSAEWFCRQCRPETGHRVLLRLRMPRQEIETKEIQFPQSASIPLVCGEQFTADEQRGYLSSLSHAALVETLVTVSRANPGLAMFPENLRELQRSKFAVTEQVAVPAAAGAADTILSEGKDKFSSSEEDHDSDESSDSGSEYEVEEHRLYPRSGNGFRLPPEEDDLDILLDDPACPTFSYTMHSCLQPKHLIESTTKIQFGS